MSSLEHLAALVPLLRSRATGAVAALGLHAGFVAWLTWPLAALARTHLPNTYDACWSDPLQIAWVLAYQSHRVVTAPWAFADANIYHPTHHALFYGEAAYGALPYFMPTFLLTGNPALSLNLVFLVSVILTAWALHLLVLRWTGSHLGGVLAGWVFLTTPWVFWVWLPAVPNYAIVQYFPLIMMWAAVPGERLGRTLRILPLVILEGLTTIYMAAAVLIPLALLGLGRLARAATRRAGCHLLLVVAAAAPLLAAAYAGNLLTRLDNPSLSTQTFWPQAALRPTALPFGIFAQMDATGVPSVTFVLIAVGVTSVLLRARGTLAGDECTAWLHAAFWAITGIVISFTPSVRWYGTTIRLPQAFLPAWLPLYQALREPFRLGVVGLLGLAVLAGLALAECVRRARALVGSGFWGTLASAGLTALLMAICYVQYTSGAGMPGTPHGYLKPLPDRYPLQRVPELTPPLLHALSASTGPLLELPAPVGSGPRAAAPQARAVYRSIFHWRPILNGYDSYWPAAFPARMEFARRLPHPEALAALRRETGLEAVLVHTRELGAAERATWLALAEGGGDEDLRLVAAEEDDLLFAVARE